MLNRREFWDITKSAIRRFREIDGEQRAAAFSYYALLSVFPLILLLVTIGSFFMDRERVIAAVLRFASNYIPMAGQGQNVVVDTVDGVLRSRGRAGFAALLVLAWSSMKFVKVLIRSTNRAWDSPIYNWWRLPLKSFSLLGIVAGAVLLGILAPATALVLQRWIPESLSRFNNLFEFLIALIPTAILFLGFCLLYKLAPNRPTKLNDVWMAALGATAFFRVAEVFFIWYARDVAQWNAVYGALGGMIAFLMWVYISGWILVLGVCFCTAITEFNQKKPAAPPEQDSARPNAEGND